MAEAYPVILTNMCMVYDDSGNILVENRVKKDWSGICFPGGHVEPGEVFTDSVIREVREETGLEIRNPCICGIKQWTQKGVRYIVLLYKTNEFSGTIQSSDEGEVFWIPRKDLMNYQLANDFDKMLCIFEGEFSEMSFYKEDSEWKYRFT